MLARRRRSCFARPARGRSRPPTTRAAVGPRRAQGRRVQRLVRAVRRARKSDDAERHGTFDDVIARLPYVRDLGFDVLYLTPIHPIGATNRKGRNNSLDGRAGRSRQPLCHRLGRGRPRRHPSRARHASTISRGWSRPPREHGLEIALDFAIQCSPDHPWIKEHPEWFDWRPDGTHQLRREPAEEVRGHRQRPLLRRRASRRCGWRCATSCCSGSSSGVQIFRVDNPHTKPLPFWEWLIARGAGARSRRDLPRPRPSRGPR